MEIEILSTMTDSISGEPESTGVIISSTVNVAPFPGHDSLFEVWRNLKSYFSWLGTAVTNGKDFTGLIIGLAGIFKSSTLLELVLSHGLLCLV